MSKRNVGFIGAGHMARALAAGIVRAGLVEGNHIHASDPVSQACDLFASEIAGSQTTADNTQVAGAAEILFLATKPQHLPGLLADLKDALGEQHLVISIAAGVPLQTIAESVGPAPRLVRVMPNTPCLIATGASGYALGLGATEDDARTVEELLSAVGLAIRLPEPALDAVTGLSGSGPALVYTMIEALADGGVRMGLARDVALRLAAQTVRGAAGMVLETGEHPGVLKDRVASPGGTTIAGLKVLEQGGVRGTLIEAVEAATKRSIELGSS